MSVKLCKHGHEMTPENTGWKKRTVGGKPYSVCKTCRRVINQKNFQASKTERWADRERLFQRYQELRSIAAVAAEEGRPQIAVWRTISLHPDYQPLGITACKHGHELTPENTMWRSHSAGRGKLYPTCKACRVSIIDAADGQRLAERERLFQRYQELRSLAVVAKEENRERVMIWRIVSSHPDYQPLNTPPSEPSFSDDDLGIISEMWAAGYTAAKIGRRLGRTKNSIIGKVHRMGLPPRQSPIGHKQKDIDWSLVRQMRFVGCSWPTIAGRLEISEDTLTQRRKLHGGEFRIDQKFHNAIRRKTFAPLPSFAPRISPPRVPTPRISPPRAPKPRAKEPTMIADQRQGVLPRVVTLAPLLAPIYAAPPPATRTCQFPTNNGEGMRWTFCDSPKVLPGKAYCRACYNRCYLRPTAEAAYAA